MPASKHFYITTPIYYVNGVPHVGSATTTLLCDVLARYHRQFGEQVTFLTGTDEHAQKVADAAAKVGETPQAFVDQISQRYVETWKFLNIGYDDFIRTSEPRHKAAVAEVFDRLKANGEIYAGQYEGWYSVSDETFFRDSEVKDGKAIETGAIVERVTEDVYYFRLSAFGDRLLAHIEANPSFLLPDTRRNEVLSFIKSGLRDIAISRRNTGWGIPVPGDDTQVVYVWFDAVINYLTATGWPSDPKWEGIWPADVHMVGKEIYTRFHATLWPAMLMALGLPLPKTVIGHGWWLVNGEKGAKSKGNIPTPQEAVAHLIDRSGATEGAAIDALRYYLVRDISFTSDSEFSLEGFLRIYNSDLANDIGNLLNRTLNMLRQYAGSVVPEGAAARTSQNAFALAAATAVTDVEAAFEALNPSGALTAIARLVATGNKEIDTAAPWKKFKEGDTDGVADALYSALETTRIASVLMSPFIPHSAALIRAQLGLPAPEYVPPFDTARTWGLLPAGTITQEGTPIFPRALKDAANAPAKQVKETAKVTEQTVAPEVAAPADDLIDISEFGKIQLRVAEIKTAEKIEGAKKLLKLTVDAGDAELRQLVAGIAESYAPEDLPGKKIVIVANLKPATIRGVQSNGMLLAATAPDGKAILLTPEDAGLPAGSKIK
jgi:methionyl-tRNA synthetase